MESWKWTTVIYKTTIWKSEGGQRVLGSIDGRWLMFMDGLKKAKTCDDVRSIVKEFLASIENWIGELDDFIRKSLTGIAKSGTLLHLRHRVAGQTYEERL